MDFQHKIVILNCEASLLTTDALRQQSINYLYHFLSQGYRVLVITAATVSLDKFIGLEETPADFLFAQWYASQELTTAAQFAMDLDKRGIKTNILPSKTLTTSENLLDSAPQQLNSEEILQQFNIYSVLILPPIGLDQTNRTTLCGRNGGDVISLFAANKLNINQVIFLKKHLQVCNQDPAIPTNNAARYAKVTHTDILKIPYATIQHKALLFAKQEQLIFSIKSLTPATETIVGSIESIFAPQTLPQKKLRVGLIGLGTVGFGVYTHLINSQEIFELVGVAIQDQSKYATIANVPWQDINQLLIAQNCNVIIDTTNSDIAKSYLTKALDLKCHVITSNTNLMAVYGKELMQLAKQNNVMLQYSATVGGALPIIETLKQNKNHSIITITAILNATLDFIFAKVNSGLTLKEALFLAHRLGLDENYPSLDLYAAAIANKCKIITAAITTQEPHIEIKHLEQLTETYIRTTLTNHKHLALVATITFDAMQPKILIEPKAYQATSRNIGEQSLVIQNVMKQTIQLHGKGSGRWPVAQAVFNDLLEIYYYSQTPKINNKKLKTIVVPKVTAVNTA